MSQRRRSQRARAARRPRRMEQASGDSNYLENDKYYRSLFFLMLGIMLGILIAGVFVQLSGRTTPSFRPAWMQTGSASKSTSGEKPRRTLDDPNETIDELNTAFVSDDDPKWKEATCPNLRFEWKHQCETCGSAEDALQFSKDRRHEPHVYRNSVIISYNTHYILSEDNLCYNREGKRAYQCYINDPINGEYCRTIGFDCRFYHELITGHLVRVECPTDSTFYRTQKFGSPFNPYSKGTSTWKPTNSDNVANWRAP